MGIPLFFKYLRTTYPHMVREVQLDCDDASQGDCDELYLDFNCAVHRCAQDAIGKLVDRYVYAQTPHQPAAECAPFPTAQQVTEAVVEESCRFADWIIRSVAPREYVFLAIDGVPPFSKMAQQRSRRYMSDWKSRYAEHDRSAGTNVVNIDVKERKAADDRLRSMWDSNCVTPGTPFMEVLNASVKKLAASWNRRSGSGKKKSLPRVEVSDSTSPGEGEQKIMRVMRSRNMSSEPTNKNTTLPSRSSYLYGLDADLLLLGALCDCCKELRVLRPSDPPSPPSSYYLVNVSVFRSIIHDHMRAPDSVQSVLEYVVLCSLLGNDFVPGLACMPVLRDSVNDLISMYHVVLSRLSADNQNSVSQRRLVYNRSKDVAGQHTCDVDYGVLQMVLEELSASEDTRMTSVDRSYYQQAQNERRSTPAQHVGVGERYPLMHPFPDVIRPSEAGWRPRYYHYLFNTGVGNDDTTYDACADYLAGLQWSLDYHCQNEKNDTWRYRYHYAPTSLDLSNHLIARSFIHGQKHYNTVGTPNKQQQDIDKEAVLGTSSSSEGYEAETTRHGMNADMQLLMVLPPASLRKHVPDARLLEIPTCLRRGCMQYYPDTFRVLTYLKRYTSECAPVLPDIDHRRIFHEYLSIRESNNKNKRQNKKATGSSTASTLQKRPTPRHPRA